MGGVVELRRRSSALPPSLVIEAYRINTERLEQEIADLVYQVASQQLLIDALEVHRSVLSAIANRNAEATT